MIAIKPVNLAPSFQPAIIADRAEVTQISVLPAQGASGSVVLGTESEPDANDETHFVPLQGAITVAMTPEQYANWGTDDSYAENCLLDNLNLVRA